MKSFKQFLVEFKPSFQKDISSLVFVSRYNYIPISTTMFDRLFGKQNKMKACHITSEVGFKQLVKIQNTKKTISAFTKIESKDIMSIQHGIARSGGMLVMIEGYPVIKFPVDVGSDVDEQGRKWINLSRFPLFSKKIEDIKVKLMQKYTDPLIDDEDIVIETFGAKIDKKKKSMFIKDYIDECEKLIKKYPKEFKAMLMHWNDDSEYSWDEILMNQFKIKKLYIVYPSDGPSYEKINAEKQKDKWKKFDPEFLQTEEFYIATFEALDKWFK